MPNIVLSRIDERLIHGQVVVQWVGSAQIWWSSQR
ncbi:PTS sugar transporter subunit IIB [Shigella flexneri]